MNAVKDKMRKMLKEGREAESWRGQGPQPEVVRAGLKPNLRVVEFPVVGFRRDLHFPGQINGCYMS